MPAPRKTGRAAARPRASSTAAPELIVIGEGSEEERIPLFQLDDTTYTMAADMPAGIVLTAMELAGDEIGPAMLDLIKEAIGEDGWNALHDPRVGLRDLARVMGAVQQHILGQAEELGKASAAKG